MSWNFRAVELSREKAIKQKFANFGVFMTEEAFSNFWCLKGERCFLSKGRIQKNLKKFDMSNFLGRSEQESEEYGRGYSSSGSIFGAVRSSIIP